MSASRAEPRPADSLVPGDTRLLTGGNASTAAALGADLTVTAVSTNAEPTLDHVLDAVTVGVVVHAPDGSVTAANTAARSMLAGLPSTVLQHAVAPIARGRSDRRSFTLGTPRPDGTARRLVATAVPVTGDPAARTPDGDVPVVTTLRDLTVEREHDAAHATGKGPTGRPGAPDDTATLRRSLAMVERRLRATVEQSPIGSALLTPHGRFLQVNRALARMVGRPAADLVGTDLADLTHPGDHPREAPLVEQLLGRRIGSYELEKRLIRPGGEAVWVRSTMTPVCEDDGSLLHLVLQVQDISETRLAVEMLTHQATHDALTGLANRALCVGRIQQALDHARRRGLGDPNGEPVQRVAVLCCDLDGFRVVNDSAGPPFGDAVLIEVARRLRRAIGPRDTAARLAGDEFVVVRDGVDGEEEAVRLARAVLEAVRVPVDVDGRVVVPTASIGIALSPAAGASPAGGEVDALTLLRDAGAALHAAKRTGRGQWQVMDAGLRRRTVDRLDLESELRSGLIHDQLRLHVQPIVDLSSGAVVGREALVRWQHPELGLLPPNRFLTVAEETGLIEDLGRWVIGEAARIAAAAPGMGYVAINVSPSQVRRTRLADDVERALEASGLPPSRLVVELTESVVLGADSDGRRQLERLDELGVRLVVDDFGTGFSALSHLRDLPVSGIKIDRSFTQGLGEDAQCERIVEALTGLARGLSVDLVAEGVETERQAEHLADIGCLHAQGYLFGRPEPAS